MSSIVWPRRSWGFPFIRYVQHKDQRPVDPEDRWNLYEPEQGEFNYFRDV